MVVQHNLTAINSNRMLGLTTASQAKSTEKLSSGYKINRAADDAAGLSISEKMRKQIRGLTQASANAQDGISTVQTAEGALTEVHDMLQRMNELAVKASNGTMSESDRTAIQNEVDQLVTEIDRVSETTKFNETYLLRGDENVPKKVDFEYKQLAYTADKTLYDATGTAVEKGTVLDTSKNYYASRTASNVAAEKVDVSAANKDIPLFKASAVQFDQAVYTRDEDGSVTYVAAGTDVAVGTTVYSSATAAAKGKGDASLTADKDYYEITSAKVDGDANVAGWKDKTGIATNANFKTGGAATGTAIKMYVSKATSEIDLSRVDGNGNVETFNAGEVIDMDDVRDTAATNNLYKAIQYTAADQIDPDDFGKYANAHQLMDSDGNEVSANGLYSFFDDEDGDGTYTYKGGLYLVNDDGTRGDEATAGQVALYVNQTEKELGALTLTLHVGADATTNNQISVELDAMSASSLGIEGIAVDGKDDTNALNAIETVKAALQQVSEQRSALGAIQNRLEHTINNLDNVVENTTSAESQIRDTDMATEMVKYSNNNILAQAGQAMLAQANQSNQGVLSLLG